MVGLQISILINIDKFLFVSEENYFIQALVCYLINRTFNALRDRSLEVRLLTVATKAPIDIAPVS
jgi:hypothetical protein